MPSPDISNCCHTPLLSVSGDEGTGYYLCTKCKRGADPYVAPKKRRVKKYKAGETFEFNPLLRNASDNSEILSGDLKKGSHYKATICTPPPCKKGCKGDKKYTHVITDGWDEKAEKEKECEHVWDDSELNPTCHESGKDMSNELYPQEQAKQDLYNNTRPCPEDCGGDDKHEHVAYTNKPKVYLYQWQIYLHNLLRYILLITIGVLLTLAFFKFYYDIHTDAVGNIILFIK